MAHNYMGPDHDQPFLPLPDLRDRLPERHPARVVLDGGDPLEDPLAFGVLAARGWWGEGTPRPAACPARHRYGPGSQGVVHQPVELQVQGTLRGRHQATS
jgi:hypothetical protein